MGAFHAYDVRGVYNVDFNRKDVYKIGYHLVGYLGAREVIVGRDARSSSPEIFEALSRGIMDAGADVLSLGLATTPMVYYATATLGKQASVQITASHNPREYNGLKVSRENAVPVGYDTGLGEIERRCREQTISPAPQPGQLRELDIREEYVAFLQSFARDISQLEIAIDCSNGMAGLLIHDVLPPGSYALLYDEVDGRFPNHEANPLIPENTRALRELVLAERCDAGMIFDGDGDRVVFVDERGRAVPSDIMLAVMGHYFLTPENPQRQRVLVDIRTSRAVAEHLGPMGADVQTWRVGRAFMAPRLREIDGLFGGELAGHYYFRDFFYSDSGLLAAIILLNVVADLKRQGGSLARLVDSINTYANSGEVNFTIEDKAGAMEAVKNHFVRQQPPLALYDYDGYRVEYADWWFNIRPSNTEPLLRFLAEARDPQTLEQKLHETREILAPFQR
ncbi:MAG: phosphoglucomutase [Bacteroidia bacterium]|nr:MAG: phosphoglucomutase [Bacteroidia bacterium]